MVIDRLILTFSILRINIENSVRWSHLFYFVVKIKFNSVFWAKSTTVFAKSKIVWKGHKEINKEINKSINKKFVIWRFSTVLGTLWENLFKFILKKIDIITVVIIWIERLKDSETLVKKHISGEKLWPKIYHKLATNKSKCNHKFTWVGKVETESI